jgi:hypothetical protein
MIENLRPARHSSTLGSSQERSSGSNRDFNPQAPAGRDAESGEEEGDDDELAGGDSDDSGRGLKALLRFMCGEIFGWADSRRCRFGTHRQLRLGGTVLKNMAMCRSLAASIRLQSCFRSSSLRCPLLISETLLKKHSVDFSNSKAVSVGFEHHFSQP